MAQLLELFTHLVSLPTRTGHEQELLDALVDVLETDEPLAEITE